MPLYPEGVYIMNLDFLKFFINLNNINYMSDFLASKCYLANCPNCFIEPNIHLQFNAKMTKKVKYDNCNNIKFYNFKI